MIMHKTDSGREVGKLPTKENGNRSYGIHRSESRGDWMTEIGKELEDNEKQIDKYNAEMEKSDIEAERREFLRQQLEEAQQDKEDLQWRMEEMERRNLELMEKQQGQMQQPEDTAPIKEQLEGVFAKEIEIGKKVGSGVKKVGALAVTASTGVPVGVGEFLDNSVGADEKKKTREVFRKSGVRTV
jgi:hypothetical protein